MIRWVLNRWRERQRAIDLAILWPICRDRARSLEHARAAFLQHALLDPAWLALDEDEVIRRVSRLE